LEHCGALVKIYFDDSSQLAILQRLKIPLAIWRGILYANGIEMDANDVCLAIDDFQLLHRTLAADARAASLRRADRAAMAMVRRWDKASTLAALRPLRTHLQRAFVVLAE
jgi:hypothetical protein